MLISRKKNNIQIDKVVKVYIVKNIYIDISYYKMEQKNKIKYVLKIQIKALH